MRTGWHSLELMFDTVVRNVPWLLIALLVFCLGVVITLMLRSLVASAVRRTGLEALAEKVGLSRILYALGWQAGLAKALSDVVLVAGLLATVAMTADFLGLTVVADGLSVVLSFVPKLLTAAALLVVGHVGADMARGIVANLRGGANDGTDAKFAGNVVYYLLVAVAGALAAEHVGLQTSLVNGLILVIAAAGLGMLALGFGLGAQGAFRDIVDKHYAERLFPPGTHIDLDGVSGEVLRYGPRSVVVRQHDVDVVLSCGLLMQRTQVRRHTHHDSSPGDPTPGV